MYMCIWVYVYSTCGSLIMACFSSLSHTTSQTWYYGHDRPIG